MPIDRAQGPIPESARTSIRMLRGLASMACAALLCASPLQAAEDDYTAFDIIEGLGEKGWLAPYMVGLAHGHNLDAPTKYLICLPPEFIENSVSQKDAVRGDLKKVWLVEAPPRVAPGMLIGRMMHLYPCPKNGRP